MTKQYSCRKTVENMCNNIQIVAAKNILFLNFADLIFIILKG